MSLTFQLKNVRRARVKYPLEPPRSTSRSGVRGESGAVRWKCREHFMIIIEAPCQLKNFKPTNHLHHHSTKRLRRRQQVINDTEFRSEGDRGDRRSRESRRNTCHVISKFADTTQPSAISIFIRSGNERTCPNMLACLCQPTSLPDKDTSHRPSPTGLWPTGLFWVHASRRRLPPP